MPSANQGNQPAVWVVDPKTNTTKLVSVEVQRFETSDFLVAKGLVSADQVNELAGALITVLGIVWSIKKNKNTPPPAAPAA